MINQIIEFFKGLFDYSSWPPRWECGYWSSFHGWLYIISELMVWTAYFLIPLIIINYFNRKRGLVRFRRVYLLFATFILLCGATHFIDALMFWIPMYRFNAVVRLLTGVVSLFTVYHLMRVLPQAFRQRTNLELESEIRRREEAEEKLREANQSLQSFAYMASHDLQEPLRKISTYASMMVPNNTSGNTVSNQQYTEKIIQSAGRMRGLIESVMLLSSIQERVELQPVDPKLALEQAIVDLELAIREKDAVINLPDSMPAVLGYQPYLSQLFLNLVNNALKFNASRPVITVAVAQLDGQVEISITDNGIGIEERYLQSIFDAFERVPTNNGYKGSGIGLAICRRIMEVHKGIIDVESEPGRGTTFRMQFKAAGS